MDDGTINANADICPRQSSRGLVSKSELDFPQHNSGLPGKSRSMIAAVQFPHAPYFATAANGGRHAFTSVLVQ
jgi:hypothetical protein